LDLLGGIAPAQLEGAESALRQVSRRQAKINLAQTRRGVIVNPDCVVQV